MPNKFYAVQIGREPGVYETWEGCKSQTDGYPGPKYKSFKTRAEAVAFVAAAGEAAPKTAKRQKFYAVAIGQTPGIYEDWDSASAQTNGAKGRKFKGFDTLLEAEEFMRVNASADTVRALGL